MIRITKGLALPITGEPKQSVENGPQIRKVGLIGDDYVGMKPTMEVAEGDAVKLGQTLFTDKKTPGVRFTSPGCGRVVAVNYAGVPSCRYGRPQWFRRYGMR